VRKKVPVELGRGMEGECECGGDKALLVEVQVIVLSTTEKK